MSTLINKIVQHTVDEETSESAETEQLIALSHNVPSVIVSDAKSAQDFLEDDGGY
jgi:hypothetical protein